MDSGEQDAEVSDTTGESTVELLVVVGDDSVDSVNIECTLRRRRNGLGDWCCKPAEVGKFSGSIVWSIFVSPSASIRLYMVDSSLPYTDMNEGNDPDIIQLHSASIVLGRG